jgi:c-di-GMP-binding flagellar brake protein YcgR
MVLRHSPERRPLIEERRSNRRIPVQQAVTVALGNGGHQVSALSANISAGGVFVYSNRFLPLGSKVALIIDLMPEITKADTRRVWCEAKVMRIDQELKDGQFGIALAFLSVHPLPQA